MINKVFPGTIKEKYIISKANRSKFETNINHDLTIQAAKELGCTVVNIGAEDLSSGQPHLILGLLWQIIKVSSTCTVSFFLFQQTFLFPESPVEKRFWHK
jgi:plastin-1